MFQKQLYQANIRTRALVFVAALFCVSCSTSITGRMSADGSARLVLQSALFPGMNRLLNRLGPQDGSAPVLDAALLNAAFSAMPGIKAAYLGNTPSGGVEGRIEAVDTAQFFNGLSSAAPAKNAVTGPPFAVWEQTANGGRLAVTLNRETGRELVSRVSTDMADYLSALMAPIATGEAIDKAGYLELVASVYGKTVADEIDRARLSIKLDFPGNVEGVIGGTYSGSRAEFEIPLIDTLVLDRTLFYEIRWKSRR
jgi:hypothetical protein